MKSTIRAVAIVGCAAALCRAQSPAPFAALETPIPPTSMLVVGLGDFDGDGDRDLYGLGPPYVLLNDGGGRFAPLAATPGAVGPPAAYSADVNRFVVADFDSDGRDDLVGSSLAAPTTSVGTLWLATGGPAGFVASALPAPTGPPGLVVGATTADVNSDGLPDLIVGRALPMFPGTLLYGPTAPDVLLNAGGGVLTPSGPLGLVYHTVFADLDLDGDPDALLNFGGVQFNSGGVFGPIVPAVGGPPPVLGPRLPSVAFLNGDLYPDLVVRELSVAGQPNNQVTTYLGGPTGFVVGPIVPSGYPGGAVGSYGPPTSVPPATSAPAVCDSNADGVDEIYVAMRLWTGLERYDPVGTSLVFTGPADEAYSLQTPVHYDFVADVDLDGREDLISFAGATWTAVFGAAPQFRYDVRFGAGTPGAPRLALECGALPPRALIGGLAVADLDGDGDLDLAGVERFRYDVRLVVATNDGAGSYYPWNATLLYAANTSTSGTASINTMLHCQVVAGDFDGDGDADLAVIETRPFSAVGYTGEDTVIKPVVNLGVGGLNTAPPILPVGAMGAPTRAVVADFDQDGRDDVALQYVGVFGLGLFIARGSATGLTLPPAITTLPTAYDLAAADFDGDGDVDLAAAGAASTLFLNVGGFSFVPSPAFGAAPATFVTANDVDLDGDTDVWLDMKLWTRNGGAWTHVGTANANAPPAAYPTQSFDFEGDGDVDTFVGSGFLHTVAGPGAVSSFGGPVPTNPVCSFADVDRDGDRDLLYMPVAPGLGIRPSGTPLLYLNRSRQTTVDVPLRAGRSTHVGLHGAPNGLYFLFASLGTTSLAAPPFGTLFLDPASTILVAGGTLDATGFADAAGFLPASFSALAGLEIDMQGLVDTVAGPRLTNARRAFVRDF
jgi:hypothetical protein